MVSLASIPEIIGSRTPSAMKLSGLYWAIDLAGSIISSWGKKAEERKRTTRTSGKRPWTTLALPVRSAIAAPMPPTAIAEAVISAIASSAPGTPPSMWAPKISPIARNQREAKSPSAAVVAGQHHRLHHRAGKHELEEALDRREARQFDPGAGAAGLDRQQQGREDDDRRDQLRPAEGLADRARPQCPHHPRRRRQVAHAPTGSSPAASASSSSRW